MKEDYILELVFKDESDMDEFADKISIDNEDGIIRKRLYIHNRVLKKKGGN